jgi:hypothetical protein
MSGVNSFSAIVGVDLDSAIAEITHTALMEKNLPHNVPAFSKYEKTKMLDALIKRLENVKARVNMELA